MTSQLIILEVRGLWPIIITVASLIFSYIIVYIIARITSARNFSKKNMTQMAKEKISELTTNLALSEIERKRVTAEKNLFRTRLETIQIQSARPLDIEQELQKTKEGS